MATTRFLLASETKSVLAESFTSTAGAVKGRTSTVVGCLLIDDGLDYEAAIARIAELRAGTRKAIDACPESPAQHRLLRERAGHFTSGPAR